MKLGSITTIISGYAFRGGLSNLSPGDKRLVRPSDLDNFDESTLDKYALEAPTMRLRKSDILLSNKGKFRAVLVNHAGEYVVSSSIFVLRQQSDDLSMPFLVAFINSRIGQASLAQLSRGSNIPALTKATLMGLEVPSLPKIKQMQIAQMADQIADYRRLTDEKINASEGLINQLIKEMKDE